MDLKIWGTDNILDSIDMVIVHYKYRFFDVVAATAGGLCLMIKNDYSNPENPNTIDNATVSADKSTIVENEKFKGAGICSVRGHVVSFVLDSIEYLFDTNGFPSSHNALGWNLYSGEIIGSSKPQDVGTVILGASSAITRSAAGTVISYDFGASNSVVVDLLNSRDAFAMQALQGIMERMESRPDTVGDSEMNHLTSMAYRWAANMMMSAALARADFKSDTEGEQPEVEETGKKEVGALEGNTEKLLNNIVAALERTDTRTGLVTTPAHWEKSGEDIVEGGHTDAVALTLPSSSGTPYTNVELAESDGWSWKDTKTSSQYAERISNPEAYQLWREYVSHTEEPEVGSEDEPVTKKYGLYDLIQAIKDIDAGGSGGTTEVDFTSLITALQGLSTDRAITSIPNINIGDNGLGKDADHPIYISGGGFPSRQVLAAAFVAENSDTSKVIHDFLTFNTAGAVGYSTKEETKKAVLGYLNNYADLSALSAAIYNSIKSSIDNRIKEWLQAAKVTVNGTDYSITVVTPT